MVVFLLFLEVDDLFKKMIAKFYVVQISSNINMAFLHLLLIIVM